jgi:hypothetical protein
MEFNLTHIACSLPGIIKSYAKITGHTWEGQCIFVDRENNLVVVVTAEIIITL